MATAVASPVIPMPAALPDGAAFKPFEPQKEEFRNYVDSTRQEIVQRTYATMHRNQTVAFVKEQHAHWGKFNHARATIMECIELLDNLVDDSDPDIGLPNSVHAFQTAERVRECFPEYDWLHLVALVHDLGKVMALWGAEQWAVVGDTYPVGCKPADSCVFVETFADNPDMADPRFNTLYGIYAPRCGLDNLTMSWGHDEYMYRVLKHNGSKLPEAGHKIIRYHSFYPWHTYGSYRHLCNDDDQETLEWVERFNPFDLYSKGDDVPDVAAIKPYYQALIDKYLPGVLEW